MNVYDMQGCPKPGERYGNSWQLYLHSSMQAELHSLTYWTASNGSNAELKLHTHTFVASIRVSISVRTRVCELLCNGAPRPFEPSDFCSYFGT